MRPATEVLAERAAWLERVQRIKQWSRGGKRAPHKPLLILYALGRLQRTGTSRSSFAEAEPVLDQLLADFGPPKPTSPAYPFHHLSTDGFWTVATADGYAERTDVDRHGPVVAQNRCGRKIAISSVTNVPYNVPYMVVEARWR